MDWARIQSRLVQLRFEPGPVDGIRGRRTIAALRRFQLSRNLSALGIVDPGTLDELFGPDDVQREALDLPWFGEAQRLAGLREVAGPASNPAIMEMAEALDLDYAGDDVPWCGLFVGHCIAAALPDEALPANVLGARQWLKFGTPCLPGFGAVLVFWRGAPAGWKGHVGFYAGEDGTHYRVLGGNQSNAVNVRRIDRDRLLGARWPRTGGAQPGRAVVDAAGPVSDGNEA